MASTSSSGQALSHHLSDLQRGLNNGLAIPRMPKMTTVQFWDFKSGFVGKGDVRMLTSDSIYDLKVKLLRAWKDDKVIIGDIIFVIDLDSYVKDNSGCFSLDDLFLKSHVDNCVECERMVVGRHTPTKVDWKSFLIGGFYMAVEMMVVYLEGVPIEYTGDFYKDYVRCE